MIVNIKELTTTNKQTYFKEYSSSPETVVDPVVNLKHTISVQGESIFYTLTNVDENKKYYNVEIPYSLIKDHASFGAQTYWGINDYQVSNHITIPQLVDGNRFVPDQETTTVVRDEEIVPIFDLTYQQRDPNFTSEKLGTAFFPLKIFVPYDNCPFEDIQLVLGCEAGSGSSYELELPEGVTTRSVSGVKDIIATISSSVTVDENGHIGVRINTDARLNTIYVEPVAGLVNKTRVNLVDGSGSFVVIPTGLSSGDKVIARLGHNKFVAASVFEYTL